MVSIPAGGNISIAIPLDESGFGDNPTTWYVYTSASVLIASNASPNGWLASGFPDFISNPDFPPSELQIMLGVPSNAAIDSGYNLQALIPWTHGEAFYSLIFAVEAPTALPPPHGPAPPVCS